MMNVLLNCFVKAERISVMCFKKMMTVVLVYDSCP